jgi:hypothetical protein
MAGPNTIDGGDIIDVTFVGRLYGQQVLNTLHYEANATGWYNPILELGYNDIATKIQEAGGVRDKFVACISADYSLEKIRCQVISPLRKGYMDFVDGTVGTLATAANVPNIAANIELRNLAVDKPSFRSFWIPGVPSDVYTSGLLDPTYVGHMDTLAAKLIGTLTVGGGSTLIPVCFTRAAVTTKSRQITFYNLHNEVRVLTRRTVGRGI